MNIGMKVRLVNQGPRMYIVASCEERDELTFYRLREVKGGLFLASSLKAV